MSYYNDDIGAWYAEQDFLEREEPEFLEKYEDDFYEDTDYVGFYGWEEF